MARTVTHSGLAGQDTFAVPFGADAASDLTVSVDGLPASFTFNGSFVVLSSPLTSAASVTITVSAPSSTSSSVATEATLQAILNALQAQGGGGGGSNVAPSTAANVTSVNAATSSVQLIGSNATRHPDGVDVVNDSASATLYVRPGSAPASTTNFSYKLAPGQSVLIDNFTGPIQGVWDAASGSARMTEYL